MGTRMRRQVFVLVVVVVLGLVLVVVIYTRYGHFTKGLRFVTPGDIAVVGRGVVRAQWPFR